jgi:predicted O-linked N-acetylglucosamine transferase (SPINDLY family)
MTQQNNPSQTIARLMHEAAGLYSAGRIAEAAALYDRVLALDPSHIDALQFRAVMAQDSGELAQAVEFMSRAAALRPQSFSLQNNLGEMLRISGRFEEAIECYRRAHALRPDVAAVLVNLGTALQLLGRSDEAIDAFRQAIMLAPDDFDPHFNLGATLYALQRFEESAEAFRSALRIRPGAAHVHTNLAAAQLGFGLADDAEASLRESIRLAPDRIAAWNLLALHHLTVGRLDEAIDAYRHAVQLRPDLPETRSNLFLALNYHPTISPADLFAEHRAFAEAIAFKGPIAPHANGRRSDRPLRIGYVSGDFRDHAAGFFIEPVLAAHVRDKTCEVFCYSSVPQPDDGTARMHELGHSWREITRLNDDQAAQLIRHDGIDILIDLAGHTAYNRLGVFARKPAPIQMTWIGYPNTTGLATMDYWITDGHIDPPGQTEPYCTEKLLRLPETFTCYAPPREAPPVSELPAIRKGYVTFGSFNHLAKLNDGVIALWARVLNSIETAQLRIITPRMRNGQGLATIRARCEKSGMPMDRVHFVDGQALVPYLQSHDAVDIALDCFPFCGHTVSLHALWMGVPVMTLEGNTHVSRRGVSILRNLGLPELIARDEDDYVRIANALASDLDRLALLRRSMRERMRSSPILDATKLVQNLNCAFREAWRAY